MCLFPQPNTNYRSIAYKKGLKEYECGKCPECLGKRSSAWALRAVMQARESKNCCMVTLTYDTFIRDEKGNIIGENLNLRSVDKKDCQLFIKRLRSYFDYHYNKKDNKKDNKEDNEEDDEEENKKSIKYIISAEYGKTTGRPHYHALLFGVKFDDLVLHKKSKRGNKIYISKTLEKLWKHGICTVDACRVSASIAKYCTKYCMKDFGADDTFMLCSQNIGITELMKAFNGLSYWIDGQEYPIPRVVWQKYISKKYHFERKQFNFIDCFTGEIIKASPTFKYVNKEKDLYYGIRYSKEFDFKSPYKKVIPTIIQPCDKDDISHRVNKKARSLAMLCRDRDKTYQGYLQYWRCKAQQRKLLPVETRIALLRDKQYHNYKTEARKYLKRFYDSGYTDYHSRPRFVQRHIPPLRTCPYPPCHIRASDRKTQYIVFDEDNIISNFVPKNIKTLKKYNYQPTFFD